MFENVSNFLDLEEEYSGFESSKAVILPIPYEKTVSFGKGTSHGPSAIIDASRSVELYDEELFCEPCDVGIHTLKALEADLDPPQMTERIRSMVEKVIGEDKFLVCLGGEHTISLGTVRGFKSKYKEFSVLNIDAHCDLREEYEGSKICHATVMKRIFDEGMPVVEVGIRSYSKEESQLVKNSEDLAVIHASEISGADFNDWSPQVITNLKDNVYLSIDVDGFDPSLISATGTPEPGGLGWYDVLKLLKKLFTEREVIGMDVVELAPIDGLNGPNVVTAKLVYKAIGYKFFLK